MPRYQVTLWRQVGDVEDDRFEEEALPGSVEAESLPAMLRDLAGKLTADVVQVKVDTTHALDIRHPEVGIDDMTPALWDTMTPKQRRHWYVWWGSKGHVCFECFGCSFPVAFGGAPCDYCDWKQASTKAASST